MNEIMLIILANGLVNNVVLARFLGLCSFMGVTNKIGSAIGMSLATTFVITVSCFIGWIIDHWILVPLDLEYLRLLTFIMLIASLVQLTELFVAKQSPELYRTLGIYLPLITTNCAVLGVPLLNVANKNNFVESLLFGAASAIGFSLVLVLFAGIRERVEGADVPVHFKGVAIAMVTAGLMSLAFMGFAGLDKYQ